MEINSRIKELKGSIIREVLEKANELEGSINLTIGEPDLDVPQIIKERASNYLLNNQLTYAPAGGSLELREGVANYYNEKYHSSYNGDEVIMTIGATEAVSTTIRTLIREGDEVVLTRPSYPLYENLLKLLGAKISYIDTAKNGCKLTAKMLGKVVTKKTKAIILNYPSNPSGVLLDIDEMDKIKDIVLKNNCYIISDEIYSEIVFGENKFRSFGYYRELKKKSIIINGFSKSHSMTGWRIGYILAGKELRDYLIKINQYTISSIPTLSQYAAIVALTEAKDVSEIVKVYKQRSEFLYRGLKKLGLNPIESQGTFYLFLDYTNISKLSSKDFAMDLLKETGVAVVPGEAFGASSFIRFSLTKDIEVLKDVLVRMKKYIKIINKNTEKDK